MSGVQAAPKIPHDLSAIFIECSYPAGRPTETLYGHLSADHLAQEVLNLATEVVLARDSSRKKGGRVRKRQKRDMTSPEVLYGALAGLRVYLMHCKETFSSDRPINHVIRDQCRDLLKPHNLGVEVLTADQGMKIGRFGFILRTIIGHVIRLRQACIPSLRTQCLVYRSSSAFNITITDILLGESAHVNVAVRSDRDREPLAYPPSYAEYKTWQP
ncbi:hypothetical protein EDD15DRAFT_2375947 [Pisolithus albus]|nr:hypothetical protein EDD15DRAFT_2375947 [Pisolithus albus]